MTPEGLQSRRGGAFPPPAPRTGKPLLLLIGYRAYGDWLYFVPVLPYLLERYDVHIELNMKGYELFWDDPRFCGMTYFDLACAPADQIEAVAMQRWTDLAEYLHADKVINLRHSLESECIAERYQPLFHDTVEARRSVLGGKNFYRAVFERCEIPWPEPKPNLNGLYWPERDEAIMAAWRDSHAEDFVILAPLAGTCTHKVWPHLPDYTATVLDRYPNAHIYLTGDPSVAHAQWEHPRIHKTAGVAADGSCAYAFKQVLHATKYADFVIGPETGIMVGAGMFGTHKIMLGTASGLDQMVRYHENDHSLQAQTWCSPCHRAIYQKSDCHEGRVATDGTWYPACVMTFDLDKILEITDDVYRLRSGLRPEVSVAGADATR